MCQCGCSINQPAYKLPGPKGVTWVLEFWPGCTDCDVGPSVQITKCNREQMKHDFPDVDDLPIQKSEIGLEFASIQCSMEPNEWKRLVNRWLTGTEVDGNKIDEPLVDILAGDIWSQFCCGGPKLVEFKASGLRCDKCDSPIDEETSNECPSCSTFLCGPCWQSGPCCKERQLRDTLTGKTY